MRTCEFCGLPLVKKAGRGRWPRFCGLECKRAAVPRYDHECVDCGRQWESTTQVATYCGSCSHRRAALARDYSKRKTYKSPGTCESCGGLTRGMSGGQRVRFCSKRECQKAGASARGKEATALRNSLPKSCAWCGVQFSSPRSRKFCSPRCQGRSSNASIRQKRIDEGTWSRRSYTHDKECAECGSQFVGKRNQTYCSQRCVVRVNNRNRGPGTDVVRWRPDLVVIAGQPIHPVRGGWWTAGNCLVCGAGFVSPFADVTCSPACKAARRYARESARPNYQWGDRAELARVRPEVYRRDGLVCQICLEPCDPNAESSSDWYPSLDHIVPRSKGGSHNLENLRTAHRWCNAVRGDEKHYTDADLRIA